MGKEVVLSLSVYIAPKGLPKEAEDGRIWVGDLLRHGDAPAFVRAVLAAIPSDDLPDAICVAGECLAKRVSTVYCALADDAMDVAWKQDDDLRKCDDVVGVLDWILKHAGVRVVYELW